MSEEKWKHLTPWRIEADPFANFTASTDLSVFLGGLPDDRNPDEILKDLQEARLPRLPLRASPGHL
jgi:hypothetical protein